MNIFVAFAGAILDFLSRLIFHLEQLVAELCLLCNTKITLSQIKTGIYNKLEYKNSIYCNSHIMSHLKY